MALTYIETRTRVERVEKTLTIPSNWGMFTAQGNNRMKKKAESLVKKLEKGGSYSKQIKAFEQYFKAYRRACKSDSKVMMEASDTSVREHVWGFALDAGKAVGIDYNTLDKLWDSCR